MNSKTHSPVKVGALVPSYNEAKRISRVLRVLLGLKGLDEIVVVDDGSTDGTSKFVRKHFPQVKVLTLSQNQGKAGAVLAGALHTDCDFLLLMDADLQDLVETEVEAGLRVIRNSPETDMIIFVRMAEALWARPDGTRQRPLQRRAHHSPPGPFGCAAHRQSTGLPIGSFAQ
jgi:glycosyltransferase involved in cell wall biosynthesis